MTTSFSEQFSMAAAGIYKPGQGYWTRLMSAISLAGLVLMGVSWLWGTLSGTRIRGIETVYIQGAASILVIGFFALLGYHLIGRKVRVVDFMIATEGEMKKVNWSTREEVLGSTWVVIFLTFLVAAYCLAFDLVFSTFFKSIGVLKDAGGG